jgi:hypothetical protein
MNQGRNDVLEDGPAGDAAAVAANRVVGMGRPSGWSGW